MVGIENDPPEPRRKNATRIGENTPRRESTERAVLSDRFVRSENSTPPLARRNDVSEGGATENYLLCAREDCTVGSVRARRSDGGVPIDAGRLSNHAGSLTSPQAIF